MEHVVYLDGKLSDESTCEELYRKGLLTLPREYFYEHKIYIHYSTKKED